MKTITVNASRQYHIHIGTDLISSLGAEARKLGKAEKICIVSDSTVWPLYGAATQDSLEKAGFQVISYVFPAGEESKNGQTFLSLLNYLAENKLTRSDMLVAPYTFQLFHTFHIGSHSLGNHLRFHFVFYNHNLKTIQF